MQHCDSIMKDKFSGELSWEFAQDVQDLIKVYSDDKFVIFDKTPAQVGTQPIICSCLIQIFPPDS